MTRSFNSISNVHITTYITKALPGKSVTRFIEELASFTFTRPAQTGDFRITAKCFRWTDVYLTNFAMIT